MPDRLTQDSQLALLLPGVKPKSQDWTFEGHPTRNLTHCYHDYPARMIPQIAAQLLELYGRGAKTLFDPYCGTGTSLVEAMCRGINSIGTDLNPLARLIASAKTSLPNIATLRKTIKGFSTEHDSLNEVDLPGAPEAVKGITKLDFWFKPEVSRKLHSIRSFLERIADPLIRLFFSVAFSETVRECSNTRNGEFKLYRYDEQTLSRFNPDPFVIMRAKLGRNLLGYARFHETIKSLPSKPSCHIHDFNTVNECPTEILGRGTVDIVITSPPYGDSRTTVAYGQYSRLSAAWLGLPTPEKVDNFLMGSRTNAQVINFRCKDLDQAIGEIIRVDLERANEVISFYCDLRASIRNIAPTVRVGGHVCYVVGNRRVKGVTLPTDKSIESFFGEQGFEHVVTHMRSIPNKRMPLRNSPLNISGKTENTMSNEYIVVMRKS